MPAYSALGYGIIDADQHWDGINMPDDVFSARLPARLRANAPQWITKDDGTPAISFNGGATVQDILRKDSAVVKAGMAKPAEPTVAGRLHEMDTDGIHAAILFSIDMPIDAAYEGDRDMVVALYQAYNDYKLEEVHEPSDNRLFTLGMVPRTDVKDAVAELQRCAEKGHKGVQLLRWPAGPTASADDDYFWAAAADLDMGVAIHAVSQFGNSPQDIARVLHQHAVAARFPTLRMALIEQGAGWIPYYLESSDWGWLTYRGNEWFKQWAEGQGLDRDVLSGSETIAPSEAFRQLFYASFLYEPFAVEVRHHIGTDRMMWSTDYPHGNTGWPRSRREFDHLFRYVPAEDVKLMVHDNAKRFFNLDDIP